MVETFGYYKLAFLSHLTKNKNFCLTNYTDLNLHNGFLEGTVFRPIFNKITTTKTIIFNSNNSKKNTVIN